MRDEYWHAFFWVFVIASWAFGFAYGRWAGGGQAGGGVEAMGIPIYPGVSEFPVTREMKSGFGIPTDVTCQGYYTTSASVENVMNYYRGHMENWSLARENSFSPQTEVTTYTQLYKKGENGAFIFVKTIHAGTLFGIVVGPYTSVQAHGAGGGEFFSELGKAVSIPSPFEISSWWQLLAYFTLTILAMFVLAQLFFGVGAAIFLFARGVSDSAVVFALEVIVRKFPFIPTYDAWMLVLGMLILAVNLPLCIWSAHMGAQRAVYMWRRLRGQPIKPETAVEPIFNFLIVMAISIVTGIVAAVAFSYA